jgi:hypothetical protein
MVWTVARRVGADRTQRTDQQFLLDPAHLIMTALTSLNEVLDQRDQLHSVSDQVSVPEIPSWNPGRAVLARVYSDSEARKIFRIDSHDAYWLRASFRTRQLVSCRRQAFLFSVRNFVNGLFHFCEIECLGQGVDIGIVPKPVGNPA